MPLPIPNKSLTNTYLLNPILGKDWIICVGAYCIRPTNAHNHGQMIDLSDTFQRVCNTTIPIRDKYLINTYVLNHIPNKDWMVCVVADCLRPPYIHVHGKMIDPPYTFRGVCNTPLPIRIKNLISIYRMNLKPGTCWGVCNTPLPICVKNLIAIRTMNLKPGTRWGVCNTPLPIRDKYMINTYLLNLIPEKDLMVYVEAYCIRPTNTHDCGQMIDPPDTC